MFSLAMPTKSMKKIELVDLRKDMRKPRFYMSQEMRTQIQKQNKTKQNKNPHKGL